MGDAAIGREIPATGSGPKSLGSFNVGRRGELASWRQAQPGITSPAIGRNDRRRKAQPRKARKGLPVSFIGDGAEPRNAIADGYGGASGFYPRKAYAPAYGDYARAGALDIRRLARGVTPSSDVTDEMTVDTNLGRTAVAGVVAGAWLGWPGDSNIAVWESAASRRPRKRCGRVARQSRGRLRADGWCRAQCSDESSDGRLPI